MRKSSPQQGKERQSPTEPFGAQWDTQCEGTFRELIQHLTSAPVLAYPDPHHPFELHMDASLSRLGAVLYQVHKGQRRPVAFASQSLVPSETQYLAHKLEFLALRWAITNKFRD